MDPRRLIGRTLSFIEIRNDDTPTYTAAMDGLTAGRLRRIKLGSARVWWTWSMNGPFVPPHLMPADGKAISLDAAISAFKKAFREWRKWALQQDGYVPWAGADSADEKGSS